MFGLILTSIITIFHLYVFWRVSSVSFLKNRIPVKIICGAALLLWGLFFLGRVYGHSGTGPVAAWLEFVGMIWMATLFLLTITFLAVDLVTIFGLIKSPMVGQLRGAALVAGLVLAMVGMVQGLRPPVVTHHEVTLKGLPSESSGLVLVAVSDLHLGSQLGETWMDARVQQVMAEKPDLILLIGDIYEGHERPAEKVLASVRKLNAPHGVWAVLGNHEFYGGPEVIKAMSFDSGLTVLRNSHKEILPGLVLVGVEGKGTHRLPDNGDDALSQTLAARPPGAVILLAHKPWQVTAAAAAGVGLMLSGHTHGGQIWPFGYLVKRMFPFLAGRYPLDDMTLLVCRGTGTWGPRMRLWFPGEIMKVTLNSEDSAADQVK